MLSNTYVELKKEIRYPFLTNKTKENQHKQFDYGLISGHGQGIEKSKMGHKSMYNRLQQKILSNTYVKLLKNTRYVIFEA